MTKKPLDYMNLDTLSLTSPPMIGKGSIAVEGMILHQVLLALRLEQERTGPECHQQTTEAIETLEQLLKDCGYRIL